MCPLQFMLLHPLEWTPRGVFDWGHVRNSWQGASVSARLGPFFFFFWFPLFFHGPPFLRVFDILVAVAGLEDWERNRRRRTVSWAEDRGSLSLLPLSLPSTYTFFSSSPTVISWVGREPLSSPRCGIFGRGTGDGNGGWAMARACIPVVLHLAYFTFFCCIARLVGARGCEFPPLLLFHLLPVCAFLFPSVDSIIINLSLRHGWSNTTVLNVLYLDSLQEIA